MTWYWTVLIAIVYLLGIISAVVIHRIDDGDISVAHIVRKILNE